MKSLGDAKMSTKECKRVIIDRLKVLTIDLWFPNVKLLRTKKK
jgi:hypothetical protein